jgi:hypothetical protein
MGKPRHRPSPDGDAAKRIGELEDKLKDKNDLVLTLRREVDASRDLVRRMEEQVEDADALIDSWIEAFDMALNDDGKYVYAGWMNDAIEIRERYTKLRREWNKFVPLYNAAVADARRPVGRPIGASEAQQQEVRKLRKRGVSLRGSAEELTLPLHTVVTITSKEAGTDRTTVKHLARIDPDRAAAIRWRAQVRTIDALPQSITRVRASARDLVKEAKGLQ